MKKSMSKKYEYLSVVKGKYVINVIKIIKEKCPYCKRSFDVTDKEISQGKYNNELKNNKNLLENSVCSWYTSTLCCC